MSIARSALLSGLVVFAALCARPAGGSVAWSAPIHASTLEHLTAAHHHLDRGAVPLALAHVDAILMPRVVRVAVAVSGASAMESEGYMQVAREALSTWEHAVGSGLRFEWGPPAEADVTITFQPSVRVDGAEVAGRAVWRRRIVSWGASRFDYALTAAIKVRTRLDGNRFPVGAMRHAVLHEVGHLLGLADSPVRGHAMGPVDPSAPAPGPAPEEVSALRALRGEARLIQQTSLLALLGGVTDL